MCGICGIASASGPADPERLARMSATLVHRGPDSDGALVDGPVGLAARRLAIIDLETGDQPIANEDGTIHVVQNGELYNYRELRAELERAGHRFRTHGDTEVLVHLYEQHGLDFARRLRGMFTVALWDSRERRLVLARDRYGIKPLYYRVDGGGLEFASELRALPRGEIDLDALEAFLAFNSIPAPLTIFRDTRKLPAGHLLVWEDGKTRTERFARPGPALELRDDDEAELIEELRARLRDSVRAHLVSDVPVGRAPLRRDRLLGAHGAGRGGVGRAGADVLDRVRGALVRRALGCAPGRRALRDPAPRARAQSGRRAAPPRARGRVRRAVRRLVRAADVPRLAARGFRRQGRALRRGRRRALRRLLHVRRRPPGPANGRSRAGRAAAGRAASDLHRPRELRLQGQALRPRRAPAAARAPPRLEGDLLAGPARPPDRPPAASSTRSTSCAPASPRRRAPSCSRGCRTSTSASISSTTCS